MSFNYGNFAIPAGVNTCLITFGQEMYDEIF